MSIAKDSTKGDRIAMGDATNKVDYEDANDARAYLADADELEAAVQGDAVFGEINEEGPNYKNVSLLGTVMLMVKAQIGLGVLSIPSVFQALGLVPGVILLLTAGCLTHWAGYMVGKFKLRHPEVYSVADVGYMIGGRVGREFMAISYWLFMTCIAGSGMLGISIALNAISSHGTCTAAFVAVAAIVVFAVSSIQTLEKLSWISWVGVFSITISLMIVTIGVGIQDRPAAAPAVGDWMKDVVIFGNPTFATAMSSVGSLLFAFAGMPSYFAVVAEMRDPRQFPLALFITQMFMYALYLAVGIVVYWYCGQYVASPALGSAGPLLKKVAYGIVLPALIASSVLYTHMPAKYLFVRILRGTDDLSKNTKKHYIVWFSCVAGCTLFSYVIASAIPVFGGLVGLIGALLGSILCLSMESAMWFYDFFSLRKTDKSFKYRALFAWAAFVGFCGIFICGAGTYGAVEDIKIGYAANGGTTPWSCADNSGTI
jgi:amino acid permease